MNKEEIYKILENNLDTISCREVITYIEELQDKVIKKQQRIDKAIYFIDTEETIYEFKNTTGYSNVIDYIVDINDFKNKLTKILRGKDNE